MKAFGTSVWWQKFIRNLTVTQFGMVFMWLSPVTFHMVIEDWRTKSRCLSMRIPRNPIKFSRKFARTFTAKVR